MKPFYKNYTGQIQMNDKGFETRGNFEVDLLNNTIKITELPLMIWTRNYKNFLQNIMEKQGWIEDMSEYHKTNSVEFVLKVEEKKLRELFNKNQIEKMLKLTKNFSMQNMVLFNAENQLKKYESELEILEEFFQLRLKFYTLRKNYLLSKVTRDIVFTENKLRFIILVNEEKLVLKNKTKKEVVRKLIELKFQNESEMPPILSTKQNIKFNELVVQKEDEEEVEE